MPVPVPLPCPGPHLGRSVHTHLDVLFHFHVPGSISLGPGQQIARPADSFGSIRSRSRCADVQPHILRTSILSHLTSHNREPIQESIRSFTFRSILPIDPSQLFCGFHPLSRTRVDPRDQFRVHNLVARRCTYMIIGYTCSSGVCC